VGSSIAVTTARPMGEIDIQRDGRKKRTLAAKPIIEVLEEIPSVEGTERMREKKGHTGDEVIFPSFLRASISSCKLRHSATNR